MGPHAPQHRHQPSHPGSPSQAAIVRRRIAVVVLSAVVTAALPMQAQAGQLLGGLLDKPLSNLLGALPLGTTRVIIRTERGALSPVLRLVTALGGRLLSSTP